jgi:hypothetical protein
VVSFFCCCDCFGVGATVADSSGSGGLGLVASACLLEVFAVFYRMFFIVFFFGVSPGTCGTRIGEKKK